MKFLLIILVAGCQISFGQDRDALAWAGCYELQAEGQHSLISNYGVVPRRLQLTVERESIRGSFLAKREGSSGPESLGRWYIKRDGSVEVSPRGTWITDGWFIELRRSGREFRGTARYLTDTGGGLAIRIVGHKVACLQGQSPSQSRGQTCVETLSSFAINPLNAERPKFPEDREQVSLEYRSSGCFGRCPSFTLRIEKNRALWEGVAFVKKKGEAEAKISTQEFRRLIEASLDAKIYAMRDDYCDPTCPDGHKITVTDINGTSITLSGPEYRKQVSECSISINGKPLEPTPPAEYFYLSHQLADVAKSHGWY